MSIEPVSRSRPDDDLPCSIACERNREPILGVLVPAFAQCRRVLEIGSGTGQHAVFFAFHAPHLLWQPSDRADYLAAIRARRERSGLANLLPPLQLDVLEDAGWPAAAGFDAAFMANTLHIMSWEMVEACFRRLDRALASSATLLVYGPFKRGGRHTAESNAAFDAELRARDPAMGVRDLESVAALARGIGCAEPEVQAMPANNFCLVFRRGSREG